MVINEPEGFTVRKQVTRKGKKVMRWVDMRKGVAYLFRYPQVSLAANSRYLTALAVVVRVRRGSFDARMSERYARRA